MIKNKTFINFIMVTLLVSFLTISVGKVTPIYALAVGPLGDPVYDTEIYALKDYVEANLDAPQLDIMFFLIGGLAVAQMGAQDAMLISPYPNEENVKEWLINCGIQLYNSVIGLVPEGDYYMGIPSIGSAGQKGVPRQVIKGLVAQMMGDAVVAINYPDLDTFLEDNPDKLYINFNKDLQLGVNAVFGLNGGVYNWQFSDRQFISNFTWRHDILTGTLLTEYNNKLANLGYPRYLANSSQENYTNVVIYTDARFNLFINTNAHTVSLVLVSGSLNVSSVEVQYSSVPTRNSTFTLTTFSYNPSDYQTYSQIVEWAINLFNSGQYIIKYEMGSYSRIGYPSTTDLIDNYLVGPTYASSVPVDSTVDLNYTIDNIEYYNQVADDYLLDLRGLITDLVNYVYVRQPVFDNVYDLEGNNIVPILVKISTELQNITELVAPPLPVNMNDIAELTENTYLERVKEHARNAGDIFANYVAFWHNCDSDLVYTMFGAVILVLVGAFIGKWGHS